MRTHGVNNGQALKQHATVLEWNALSGKPADVEDTAKEAAALLAGWRALRTWHKSAYGMFQADEHL